MPEDHIYNEEKIGDPRYDVRAQDDPNPDDKTIRDRVESEVFGYPDVPKGDINLNVADGVVVLRGQVANQETIDNIIDLIRAIPDVRGVESFLHLPGELPPNKKSVLEISQ